MCSNASGGLLSESTSLIKKLWATREPLLSDRINDIKGRSSSRPLSLKGHQILTLGNAPMNTIWAIIVLLTSTTPALAQGAFGGHFSVCLPAYFAKRSSKLSSLFPLRCVPSNWPFWSYWPLNPLGANFSWIALRPHKQPNQPLVTFDPQN